MTANGDLYAGVALMVRDDAQARREAAARLAALQARVDVTRVPRRRPPTDLERAVVEARLKALSAALDVATREDPDHD